MRNFLLFTPSKPHLHLDIDLPAVLLRTNQLSANLLNAIYPPLITIYRLNPTISHFFSFALFSQCYHLLATLLPKYLRSTNAMRNPPPC